MTALGGSVEEAKEACERYVAVAAAHVLLFRIYLLDGQPWWIDAWRTGSTQRLSR